MTITPYSSSYDIAVSGSSSDALSLFLERLTLAKNAKTDGDSSVNVNLSNKILSILNNSTSLSKLLSSSLPDEFNPDALLTADGRVIIPDSSNINQYIYKNTGMSYLGQTFGLEHTYTPGNLQYSSSDIQKLQDMSSNTSANDVVGLISSMILSKASSAFLSSANISQSSALYLLFEQ